MRGFKLTPDAKASLMQIAQYTERTWGKKQRNTYLKMLDDAFHTLAETPSLGKIRPEIYHAIRSLHVGKHVVFYMLKENDIVIVHILHERMEPALHINV